MGAKPSAHLVGRPMARYCAPWDPNAEVRMQMKQLQIIWGALLGGVIAYTTVVYCLMTFGGVHMGVFSPAIMNVVGGVVILYMFGALMARRTMIARIPRDAPAEQRFVRYQIATLVGTAGIEGGGLLMITASLVAGVPNWTLAGGAAAAAVLLMVRPTASEIALD